MSGVANCVSGNRMTGSAGGRSKLTRARAVMPSMRAARPSTAAPSRSSDRQRRFNGFKGTSFRGNRVDKVVVECHGRLPAVQEHAGGDQVQEVVRPRYVPGVLDRDTGHLLADGGEVFGEQRYGP